MSVRARRSLGLGLVTHPVPNSTNLITSPLTPKVFTFLLDPVNDEKLKVNGVPSHRLIAKKYLGGLTLTLTAALTLTKTDETGNKLTPGGKGPSDQ